MRFPFLELPHRVRAAFLCLLLFLVTNSSAALTLNELFAAADSLSPALATARLELAQVQSDAAAARAFPNPALFGERENLKSGAAEDVEWTYGVRQPLGPLWSYGPRRASAWLTVEAARAEYTEVRRQLQMDLAGCALTLAAQQQQVVLLDTVLAHTARAVKAMDERYRLGDVSAYEQHRLQAEWLTLSDRQRALQSEIQSAAAEFTRLSGLPQSAVTDLDLAPLPQCSLKSLEEALAIALRQRPRLLAAEAALHAAECAETASCWNQLPALSIGLGRKTATPDFAGLAVAAEIELPLFSHRRNERTLAAVAREQARLDLRAIRLQIEQEVASVFTQWQAFTTESAGHAAYDAAQARADLARGVDLYEQGELSPVELVDVLRSTLDAQDAFFNLRNRRIVAELNLCRVIGLPLEVQP